MVALLLVVLIYHPNKMEEMDIITNKKATNTLSLYQRRYIQSDVSHPVALANLDSMCNPTLINGISHIERIASGSRIPSQTRRIEADVGHIDPIADIFLG